MAVAVGAGIAWLAPASAHAEPSEAPPTAEAAASMWRPEWPQFSALEGFFTSGAVLGMVLFEIAGPLDEPRWSGGILFDDDVRDAIRASDESSRRAAGQAGDVIYYTFPVIPVVVDSLILSLIVRRDEKAALNLFLVSGEAMAYSGLLSFIANAAAARQRPDADTLGATDGFYSGHTAMASASAGAVCANHAFMPLWGHPAADATACALASSAAATTAITRLVADRHYFTDVFVGSALGFGVGFAVPTLLHYRVPQSSVVVTAAPGAPGTDAGLSVSGSF